MSELTLSLPSFAKINWVLRVLQKRASGYHDLSTIFQTVSLHDLITFKRNPDLILTSNDPRLPAGDGNLIIKAAKHLRKRFGVEDGAIIRLEKRIPFPGGLGGGSSNAAIALLGLSVVWGLPIGYKELVEIGRQLGADVPFFFVGGTAVGEGDGTVVTGVEDVSEKFLLLATPDTDIPTRDAYAKLDSLRLTKNGVKSILHNCYDDAERLVSGQLQLFNDFEKPVFQMKPEIGRLKEKVLEMGAEKALLSGSGASIFAVFDNEKERQTAIDSLSSDPKIRQFAVETVSRLKYRRLLEPCKHLLPEKF